MRFDGSLVISATVGLIGGSSVAWWRLWRKISNRMREDPVLGLGVPGGGSSPHAASTAATLRSPCSHGVSSGRKTSSRPRGRSRHRVGRFSYIVIA